jgi:hypothetical protein
MAYLSLILSLWSSLDLAKQSFKLIKFEEIEMSKK